MNAVPLVTPAYVADSVAMVVAATVDVVIANVAEPAPWPTVTLAGTVIAAWLLDKAAGAPPAGAGAVRRTVPVDGLPPTTGFGLALRESSAGAVVGGVQPSCTTSKSPALKVANAGLSTSLFQRVSKVPVM